MAHSFENECECDVAQPAPDTVFGFARRLKCCFPTYHLVIIPLETSAHVFTVNRLATFAAPIDMQYLFISIFVLSNLLNFSSQMGSAKGDIRELTIQKNANTGIALASIEFFLQETEDNKEQEEHYAPEIQGGAIVGQFSELLWKVVQTLVSGQNGGLSRAQIHTKLFLFLHNIRI
jgi:hypothetical protein